MRRFSRKLVRAIANSCPAHLCTRCGADQGPTLRQGLCDRCYQQATREWIADPESLTLQQFVKERFNNDQAKQA